MTRSLKDVDVLVLDCQATGPDPSKNHLLEIGWMVTRAAVVEDPIECSVHSYLLALPEGVDVPPRIERITGISAEDLIAAHSTERVWHQIAKTARGVVGGNTGVPCLAVIHFSRFEWPYLQHLHEEYGGGTPFPFSIICTHEIAKRLFPDLPRRGLRAIAGFLGHSLPECRRCEDHAIATAIVWRGCVELLAKDHGVHTLEDLQLWLENANRSSRSGRKYPMDRERRLSLPDQPGVYRMLRSNGDTLYVGKASALRKRVNSYFQKRQSHAEHILEMLTQARDIAVTVTGTALEAAVLESDLIKQLSPPYNIALRERNRKLWFCSREFGLPTLDVDESHSLGPFPGKEIIEGVSSIVGLIRGEPTDVVDDGFCCRILGVPPAYGPDVACFTSGLDLFRGTYGSLFTTGPLSKVISILGIDLWREHLAALEELRQEKNVSPDTQGIDEESASDRNVGEEKPPGADEERVWTPEAVHQSLEGVLRSAAHSIRRARWFSRLGDATLVWRSKGGGETTRTMVVFKEGAIDSARVLNNGDAVRISPECRKPFLQRQRNLDIITYDRMRVVTTEMRRLLAEHRGISLHLGAGSRLDNRQLSRILPWV